MLASFFDSTPLSIRIMIHKNFERLIECEVSVIELSTDCTTETEITPFNSVSFVLAKLESKLNHNIKYICISWDENTIEDLFVSSFKYQYLRISIPFFRLPGNHFRFRLNTGR